MSQDIPVLRMQIAEFLQSRKSKHDAYPRELKDAALKHTHAERARDVRLGQIAADLGLSFNTLRGWYYAKPRKPKLKPVVVATKSAPASRIVLVTQHGHRVEGLDVESMVQLLRGLS